MTRARDVANVLSTATDLATDAETAALIATEVSNRNAAIAAVPARGNTASRPESPVIGDLYANTQTGNLETYTSLGWSQIGVLPAAPTSLVATDSPSGRAYNNGRASVAFSAGTGGLPTSYTITSSPGSFTATGSTSPITVTGLQSSTQYTYTAVASNNYGTSSASSASTGVTATTVPQAPTISSVTGGNAQAVVAITANATGGSSVTGFTVTSSPGNITASGSSPITVTGLTNGTSYTFTAVATNANGNSLASSASSSVTPASFSGGNQSVDNIYTLLTTMSAGSATAPTSGGTLSINGVSVGSYDYTVKSGNQTVSSFTNSDWFTSTEDTRSAFIVVNGNLTINSGQTFIPSNRKLFTCIYVTGTLTVNGSISMTARGANHSGSGNSAGATTSSAIRLHTGTFSSVTNPQIPSSGGSGANGVTPGATNVGIVGGTGASGSAGGTGGGGSGASWQRNTAAITTSGNASGGTSFSGGSGTGGIGQDQTYQAPNTRTGPNAGANGGAGGSAVAYEPAHGGGSDAGGGAGNPGGAGRTAAGGTVDQLKPANDGGSGTGGVLVIVCNTLAGSGTISANGVSGGSATVLDGPAGGGSGGGSVTVFYQSDSSSITIQANGGAGGSSPNANGYNTFGGAGGAGTARKLALT